MNDVWNLNISSIFIVFSAVNIIHIQKMKKNAHSILLTNKKTFENQQKIEQHSFLTELERKTFEKLSMTASGDKRFHSER